MLLKLSQVPWQWKHLPKNICIRIELLWKRVLVEDLWLKQIILHSSKKVGQFVDDKSTDLYSILNFVLVISITISKQSCAMVLLNLWQCINNQFRSITLRSRNREHLASAPLLQISSTGIWAHCFSFRIEIKDNLGVVKAKLWQHKELINQHMLFWVKWKARCSWFSSISCFDP